MTGRTVSPPSTAVYAAGFVLTGMVTTLFGPILPELLENWHLTDATAGGLFTAQFAGSFGAGLASARLVSRFGEGRTVGCGYALMAVGLLVMVSGGYGQGVAGAGAIGLGLGCVIAPTNLLVARGRPENAASALGALNFVWGLGASSWPLFVGLALRHGGVRPAVIGLALLCAVAAARIMMVPVVRSTAAVTADELAKPPIGRLTVLGLLVLLYSGTEAALGGWLPELSRRLPAAASNAAAASIGMAFYVGLTLGRGLIAFKLPRRFEDVSVFAGLALTAFSFVLLMTTGDVAVVRIAAALAGAGLGPVFPVTAAAVSRQVPVAYAGPLLALGSLGAATVPFMVGAISDLSRSLTTAVASLIALLGILAVLHVVRRRSALPEP